MGGKQQLASGKNRRRRGGLNPQGMKRWELPVTASGDEIPSFQDEFHLIWPVQAVKSLRLSNMENMGGASSATKIPVKQSFKTVQKNFLAKFTVCV